MRTKISIRELINLTGFATEQMRGNKMTTKKYFNTAHKATSESYPYGRLRTTAFFSLDFDKKKGFRTVFQTIDPKTLRLNNPKKSTYSEIIVMYENQENGHIEYDWFSFYDDKSKKKAFLFLAQHFDLFTSEQKEYILLRLLAQLKIDIYSMVKWCASDFEALKPLFDPTIKQVVGALKNNNENIFGGISLDFEAIEATKKPNYNPFKVSEMD